MKVLNEINVTEFTWLVHQAKSSTNMYYAAGEDFVSNVPQTIAMKSIFETNPEERIKKLIQCGQLDVAEVSISNIDNLKLQIKCFRNMRKSTNSACSQYTKRELSWT